MVASEGLVRDPCLKMQFVILVHPKKINMEPGNDGFQYESPFVLGGGPWLLPWTTCMDKTLRTGPIIPRS